MRHFAFLFCFAFTSACYTAPVKVQSYSGDTSLPHKLLISAIERAGLDYVHPYETNKDISNARILNDVKNNQLDVMWSMTSTQLEQDYQAVYIPLFRGLLGMRVAIVKAQNRELFSSVNSLQDLKRFTAGQGKTWPDTKILKANQLPVVTTLKYPNLFPMLEGERFDYFPRGVNEPWDEIANHSELNLTVEPHLVIKYTAPLYFFVNKNNHTLHKQLNDALKEMIEDGTFNAMFLADSQVQTVLSKANLSSRRVIELDNPTLSSNTPNKNSPLWFNPFQ
ncbi:transporter substrate-binding domain-containing protein [uncultured Pseudoalteromonas sp.]|uniref:substrate-binding periplasmic protein n=1 Tax=uncultured Pseudoalteromonas sp. TaxID=114053 RepID=UPI0032B1D310